ncbi:MAG: prepilin peptidase [Myxococcaceae bacterium]
MPGLETILTVWLFLLGLVLGSFLNVVIARLPHDQSIVRPGSRCPKCGHALRWYENIPVVSWVIQAGKCRSCKAPISARYMVVELLTGFLFLGCVMRFGFNWSLVQALTLVFVVIPLVFIDAEHWILPFELTLPGLALGVLLRIPGGWDSVETGLIGAISGFVAFRLLEFIGLAAFKKEALGMGDKYLVAMLGAFLGWKALFPILFFSSVQGSVIGLLRIALTGRAGPGGEKDKKEEQAPETEQPEEEPPAPTITWEFAAPGLSFLRRVVLFLWCIPFQPIPDEEKDESGEEVEWEPGASNLPFGPWLGLSGLEVMLFGQMLSSQLSPWGLGWLF